MQAGTQVFMFPASQLFVMQAIVSAQVADGPSVEEPSCVGAVSVAAASATGVSVTAASVLTMASGAASGGELVRSLHPTSPTARQPTSSVRIRLPSS
jgi:hypothetical protein